ncbi:MAG: tautomerase family protein [Desulfitobacteriaceae bacterium]
MASQALGIPMAAFNVVLDEHQSNNMGVGGELLPESPFWQSQSKHDD